MRLDLHLCHLDRFSGDRDRTAAGDHRLLLCGRYADRRGAAFDDGIADPVRFIGAGRNVKKNIYGQAKYQKRRRKIMETYYNPEDLGKFGTIGEEAPVLAEKFFDYYGAVFAEGALTQREKSLIALAVAHAVQCPYCIDSYTNDCLNKGVSEEEMTEPCMWQRRSEEGRPGTWCTDENVIKN